MHLAQAKTLFPAFLPKGKRTHCKFGYFLNFWVGLYLPLSFTRVVAIADFFLQIEQIFSAIIIQKIIKYKNKNIFCTPRPQPRSGAPASQEALATQTRTKNIFIFVFYTTIFFSFLQAMLL